MAYFFSLSRKLTETHILHSHHVRRSRGCSRTSQNMNKDGLLRERLTRRRVRSPGTCCTTINRALHFWHFIPQLEHASFDCIRAGIWNQVGIFSQIKLIRRVQKPRETCFYFSKFNSVVRFYSLKYVTCRNNASLTRQNFNSSWCKILFWKL